MEVSSTAAEIAILTSVTPSTKPKAWSPGLLQVMAVRPGGARPDPGPES
jgi:hypothetical protein